MTTDERYNKKVIAAALERPIGGDGGFNLGKYPNGDIPSNGSCRLKLTMNDGHLEYLEYYGDEISITPQEVVGRTLRGVWDLYNEKDLACLRS